MTYIKIKNFSFDIYRIKTFKVSIDYYPVKCCGFCRSFIWLRGNFGFFGIQFYHKWVTDTIDNVAT